MDDGGGAPIVTLYTQDGCPDSERVRSCFRESGVAFVERDVTRDPAAAEALLATGVFATPVVLGAGLLVVGFRPDVLMNALGFRCRCPGVSG